MATYIYTCTKTEQYHYLTGEDPSYGIATLTVIPDGSHPLDKPETILVKVPTDYRPGKTWKVTIEET